MGEKHTPITDELNQLCRTEEDWDYSMLWESNAKLEVENGRLREIIAGMLAIEDSVTQGQERELREIWIPQARDVLRR